MAPANHPPMYWPTLARSVQSWEESKRIGPLELLPHNAGRSRCEVAPDILFINSH